MRYIVGISLIALILIILRKLANGKISRCVQYALWLVIPVFMVLYPLVTIDIKVPAKEPQTIKSEVVHDNIIQGTQGDIYVHPLEDYEAPAIESSEPKSNEHSVSTWTLVKTIYTIVVATSAAGLIVYNLGFAYYVRKNRDYIETDDKTGLQIYKLEKSGAPFLFINKIYLNSLALEEDKKDYAICHEYCHYTHGDFYWTLLRYIVLVINWYNPLIWMAFIYSEQDAEFACDESVAKIIGEENRIAYGKVLLSFFSNNPENAFDLSLSTSINGRSKKYMTERITNIKHLTKNSVVAVVLFIAFSLVTAGCSLIRIKEVVPEVPSAAPSNETNLEMLANDETPEYPHITCQHLIDVEDGYYTGTIRPLNFAEDGHDTCYISLWVQLEISQESIDNLAIGELVDISNTNVSEIYGDTVTITNLDFLATDSFYLFGSYYTGEKLYITADGSFHYAKTVSGTWKLFNNEDVPVYISSDYARIRLNSDYVIHDGYRLIASAVRHIDDGVFSEDELLALREFRMVDQSETRDIATFFARSYATFRPNERYFWWEFERAVIEVRDNEITDIWFWYYDQFSE